MTATTSPISPAQRTLLGLLAHRPERPEVSRGYLDLLGEQVQAGPPTGLAQRLMRTALVPRIYETYWRPALGRVAKGVTGPSMSGEHDLAVELLGLTAGATVLDVACGTGGFTRTFGTLVGRTGLAIGLDASATMLAEAVERTPGNAPVAYLRADAVHPPLADGSVDGVCCFAALHMFDDPGAALSSFARVLRPGGRVALLTSGRHGWQPARAVDTVLGAASGQHMFDRGEVGDLLRERGFTDVSERYGGVTQFVGATRG